METILKIVQFIKDFHMLPVELCKRYFLRESVVGILIGWVLLILMLISVIVCDLLILYVIVILIRGIIIILRTREIIKENVKGIITKKEYQESYYQTVVTGKTVVPVYHPEEFMVFIDYEGKELSFNSEKQYNSKVVGDEVNLVMIKRLDKNKKIIDLEFELED